MKYFNMKSFQSAVLVFSFLLATPIVASDEWLEEESEAAIYYFLGDDCEENLPQVDRKIRQLILLGESRSLEGPLEEKLRDLFGKYAELRVQQKESLRTRSRSGKYREFKAMYDFAIMSMRQYIERGQPWLAERERLLSKALIPVLVKKKIEKFEKAVERGELKPIEIREETSEEMRRRIIEEVMTGGRAEQTRLEEDMPHSRLKCNTV